MKGEKVGLLKIKMFRPFPAEKIQGLVCSAEKLAVIDRNFSLGAGGIFTQEIRACLCNMPKHPLVFGYIAGLGGRDITPAVLMDIYRRTKEGEKPEQEDCWVQLREVDHEIESC